MTRMSALVAYTGAGKTACGACGNRHRRLVRPKLPSRLLTNRPFERFHCVVGTDSVLCLMVCLSGMGSEPYISWSPTSSYAPVATAPP